MWRLKSCPRCGGDISIEKSPNGWEEKCLQCSYLREYGTPPALKKEASEPVSEDGGAGFSATDRDDYDKALEIFLYSKSSS